MSTKLKNGLLKVTFSHILANGTDSCWFKFKEASLQYLSYYWRSKEDFRYLKIYQKLENGSCGPKIGYITRDKAELNF
ncbi:hypothetical protein [Flavobacterium sp. ov086]|uniref:hypothetical protein n=1 Tax=Flavobacterium sp. ov086 TaxID=1761785 RepID=UPI000B635F76|nr:hypothetical protein [Flavobacterium sp. ov086]SNS02641.1 hypothetical protein SAMN04487979_14521 [Flavobacterium sp. ov086]